MEGAAVGDERVRVRRETLRAALDQYRRVLHLLQAEAEAADSDAEAAVAEEGEEEKVDPSTPGSPSASDHEADELCDLLKSKVDSPDFLKKLGSIHMSISKNISGDDSASWDMVSAADLWEDKHTDGNNDSDQGDYVLVSQEDIVEGMACFMAAYLLSLNQTKELTPNQLQEALSKTFSAKKKKSKLRKAWDGSKVIYNVASWGATAIGIYQNPALLKAASVALWSSWHAMSKLL